MTSIYGSVLEWNVRPEVDCWKRLFQPSWDLWTTGVLTINNLCSERQITVHDLLQRPGALLNRYVTHSKFKIYICVHMYVYSSSDWTPIHLWMQNTTFIAYRNNQCENAHKWNHFMQWQQSIELATAHSIMRIAANFFEQSSSHLMYHNHHLN